MTQAPPALEYQATYVDGRLLLRLMGLGFAVSAALFAIFVIFNREVEAADRGHAVATLIVTFCIGLPLLPLILVRARHTWRLYADRLEVSERPTVRLLLGNRDAVIRFCDIRQVQLKDLFGGASEFQLETAGGDLFRLAPRAQMTGSRFDVDTEAFRAFLNRFQTAVGAAGIEPPPVNRPIGSGSSLAMVILLAILTVLGALGSLIAFFALIAGYPRSGQMLGACFTLTAVAGGFLIRTWEAYTQRTRSPAHEEADAPDGQ